MSQKRTQQPQQAGRSERSIRLRAVLRVLGQVDWLRQGQRIAVFFREIRGDDPAEVERDHAEQVVRARKVRAAADRFASTVVGRDVSGESDEPRRGHDTRSKG